MLLVPTQESSASITRRFSDSVCVPVARSVSQLPIRASRCASLSCSSRWVANARSLWLSAKARSRSIAAISRFATDSTKARSFSENASRRRLQATSSPNAVSPDPIGAASRLSMPSAASPGASNVVSAERSALSSVWPAARMWPTVRRTSGEGTGGGAGGFSPQLARTEMSPLRCRLQHHDEVARERVVERPRRLGEQLVDRPVAQGERAERADGRLLGEAAAQLLPPEHPIGDVLGDHERPGGSGVRGQGREMQPVLVLAVGRHHVGRARLTGQCRAPVRPHSLPGGGGDDVVEIAADRRATAIAVALVDPPGHGHDPHLGVDDHHARLGHQRTDRLGELRRVVEAVEAVQRVDQHRAIPMQRASASPDSRPIRRSADLQAIRPVLSAWATAAARSPTPSFS